MNRIDKLDENGVGHIPANVPYKFTGNGMQVDAGGRKYAIVNGQMRRLNKGLSKKEKRRLRAIEKQNLGSQPGPSGNPGPRGDG